jgi:uncharacterized repeat protein (TIGR01451 family)
LNVGNLAANQSRQLTAKVRAEKPGTYENRATASGAGDVSVESSMVATVVREPILKITKTGPAEGVTASPFEYQITVSNVGDAPARDTIVEDALPVGTLLVNATDSGRITSGRVVWTLGTLEPQASRTMTLVVQSNSAATVKSTVSARAHCAEAVSANVETRIRGVPAMLLEVVDLVDPVRVGDTETYEITATNQGSAPESDIRIVCTLEGNQQYVSSSGQTTASPSASSITFQPVATLGPKQKATWRVIVKNVKPGDVRFKVSMTTQALERPVEETESTRVLQ